MLRKVEGQDQQSSGRMNGFAVRIKYLCLCQFELASMMQFDSESGTRKRAQGMKDVRSSSEELIEFLMSD